MATTDTIKQMRQTGYSDSDIIGNLQSQGISPREINDSFAQLAIKEAVINPENPIQGQNFPQSQNISEDTSMSSQMGMTQSSEQQMQPSMPMYSNTTQESNQFQQGQGIYSQYQPQENPYSQSPFPQQPQMPIQDYGQQYPQQQEQYTPQMPEQYQQEQNQEQYPVQQYENQEEYPTEQYPQEGQADYAQYGYGMNTETMSEIADQIITEKLIKTNNELKSLIEVKTLLDSKVKKIDDRLQRIEMIIDQLQGALIRKTMEQSQSIEDMKNELQMTQSSFSKILNPLTDNIREMEKINGKKSYSYNTDEESKTNQEDYEIPSTYSNFMPLKKQSSQPQQISQSSKSNSKKSKRK